MNLKHIFPYQGGLKVYKLEETQRNELQGPCIAKRVLKVEILREMTFKDIFPAYGGVKVYKF